MGKLLSKVENEAIEFFENLGLIEKSKKPKLVKA